MNKITRYHLDCTAPVRPPMASAIYHAQMGGCYYRMVVDIPSNSCHAFEQWAEYNRAVIEYDEDTHVAV